MIRRTGTQSCRRWGRRGDTGDGRPPCHLAALAPRLGWLCPQLRIGTTLARSESTTENGAVDRMRRGPLEILDHDNRWASAFATIGATLRDQLDQAALRIDHIGSTAVAGLAAKDVIDVQVTVAQIDVARGWPQEMLPDSSDDPL